MDVASTPDIALDGGGEHRGTAAEVEFVGMGGWADDEMEAIDLEGAASACHHLLACAPPGHWGGGGEGRGQSSILLFVTACASVAILADAATWRRQGGC